MNSSEISIFEKTYGQIQGIHNEISILSKKSPNDGINKFKLKFINSLITKSSEILDSENLPFEDFNGFDEDELPTNSDVTMILEQYICCYEKYRSENIKQVWKYIGDRQVEMWVWTIEGKESNIQTSKPKKM